MKAFIYTDVSLDTVTILKYYCKRWPIEIFFRQEKSLLGLDNYQIRSIKGIERIWILQALVHLFCTIGLDQPMKFGKGILKVRKQSKKDYIKWIYNCAKGNIPLNNVFQFLKIT
ncbi:transposase [Orenia marismortui]|uniref:transposase n=1 Tax=Orenia marismortui TaxID=46469 RepID=UPI0003794761|nr:transposase [Orenia marismortui]